MEYRGRAVTRWTETGEEVSPDSGWTPADAVGQSGKHPGGLRARVAAWFAARWDGVRARWTIAMLLPAAGPRPLLVLALLTPLQAGLPVLFVLVTGELLAAVPRAVAHGLDSADGTRLIVAVGFAAVLVVGDHALAPLSRAARYQAAQRIDGTVRDRLLTAAAAGLDLDLLARNGVRKDLTRAGGIGSDEYTPGTAASGLIALLPRYLQALGAAITVAAVSVPLGLLLAATAVIARHRYRVTVLALAAAWGEGSSHWRRSRQFLDLGTRTAAAKELRIFGLSGYVVDRYLGLALRLWRRVWRERNHGLIVELALNYAAILLTAGVVFTVVGSAAADGRLSVPGLVVTVQATVLTLQIAQFFGDADFQVEYGMMSVASLARIEAAVRTPRPFVGTGATAELPQDEIRFEDVHFSYPDADAPTLRGVDLTIRAGESTAIVGLNGAGKSTLVTLLCGLRRPTRGRILVDGTDLADLAPDQWRQRVAVVFQDFLRWPFSAADNIGFGAPRHRHDTNAIRDAIGKAGASFLDSLPAGSDTLLSSAYAGGTDLSGGQWQRVALARAFFAVAHNARVLVLDEPTASLDIRAEAALFDELLNTAEHGTTVLISHRLATIRRADRIAVLADGRVAEQGTHAELLAAEGRYADLFRLQAARYAEELGASTPDRRSGQAS